MKFILPAILTVVTLLGCQPQLQTPNQQKFQIAASDNGLAWIINTQTGDAWFCKAQKDATSFDFNLGANCLPAQMR